MTTRRSFIATSSLTASALGLRAQSAGSPLPVIGHGAYRYNIDKNWGALDPSKYPIVNCHAMVQTSDGLLHTLCDGVRNNFLVYDRSGKLLRSWGTEYPGAHGLELAHENGRDYFLVIDGGWMVRGDDGKASREQGSVTKITPDGHHLFSIGSPVTDGAYEPGMNFQPCDAAVAPNGDIYVADGYGSQWVLHYDNNGRFIDKFGGPGELDNCHGISIDNRDPADPRLVVSSRSKQKLKWYSLAGEPLFEIDLPGAFAGQCVFSGDIGVSAVCWSKDGGTGNRLSESGFVTILDRENRVVSNPGGTEPKYTDGKLQPIYQSDDSFIHAHDICIDDEGSIYVVQWNSRGTYPVKLTPVA